MTNKKELYFILLICMAFLNGIQSQGLCDTKHSFKTKDGKPLNLLDLKTNVHINGTYAEIEYTQIYENHFNETVETEFYFPRNEKSIFHKFVAVFENLTIEGKIFEKEEANKLYEESKAKGNTVAYSEINEKVSDVMKILVGNLPSKAKIEIKFSIIEPVEIILNKLYSFRLQSTLTPRYSAKDSIDPQLNPDLQCVQSKDSNVKNWHIKLVFISDESLEYIKNPSHKMLPKIERMNTEGDGNGTYYKYTFESDFPLNKDFEVNWSYPTINLPQLVLSEHPEHKNDYVLLTSFLPDLNNMTISEVEDKFLSGEHLNYLSPMDLEAPVEFIFIIDRSGSMQGKRIVNLKKALKSFINLLPSESYFNVVSFGNDHEVYSQEGSLKTSKGNVKHKFLEWVDRIDADMGGTEIYGAVEAAINLKKIENHTRIIVLLTDGDVYDSSRIIDLVKKETISNPTKFCSAGIGNGISYTFIKEFGRYGRCASVFVKDEEDIGDKTIHIVKSSLSQHLKDIKFDVECYNKNGNLVFTEKKSKNFVLKNERVNEWFYIHMNRNLDGQEAESSLDKCNVKVSYKSSFNGGEYSKNFTVENSNNPNNFKDTEVWHKIAYFEKINKLDTERENNASKKETIDKQIVDISLKYQILSKLTSFFTVIKETKLEENSDALKSSPKLIKIRNVGTVDWNEDTVESLIRDSQPYGQPMHKNLNSRANYAKMAYIQADPDEDSQESSSFYPSPPSNDLVLIDVTVLDLSVEIGNKLEVIIPRGMVIPCKKEKTFRLEELCKIESLKCQIIFWMGSRKNVQDNFKVEEIEIDISSLLQHKIESLKIIAIMDENSIIEIRITDEADNLITMKKVYSHLKLTQEDFENLIRGANEDELEKDDL